MGLLELVYSHDGLQALLGCHFQFKGFWIAEIYIGLRCKYVPINYLYILNNYIYNIYIYIYIQ